MRIYLHSVTGGPKRTEESEGLTEYVVNHGTFLTLYIYIYIYIFHRPSSFLINFTGFAIIVVGAGMRMIKWMCGVSL